MCHKTSGSWEGDGVLVCSRRGMCSPLLCFRYWEGLIGYGRPAHTTDADFAASFFSEYSIDPDSALWDNISGVLLLLVEIMIFTIFHDVGILVSYCWTISVVEKNVLSFDAMKLKNEVCISETISFESMLKLRLVNRSSF